MKTPIAFLIYVLTFTSACCNLPDRAVAQENPAASKVEPDNAQDQDVESILKTRLAEEPIGSAISAVVVDEHGVNFFNVGNASKDTDAKPVDSDSVYEIGSVTKVFTGILLAEATKRGEVNLDDPISKFLPSTIKPLKFGDNEITLLDLTTHGSALPSLPNNLEPEDPLNPYAGYSVQQMHAFLGGYKLTREIGSKFEYSNLGVGLLGQILAKQAAMSYEELVKSRILEPLGMTNTAITFTPEMKSHLAVGHDAAGNQTANWDLPTFAGAGALRSTPTDMAKFLRANLGFSDSEVGDSLAQAQKIARVYEMAGGPATRVGFNWFTTKSDDIEIQWHNGGTGGYRTYAGMDHANKKGVFVATNGFASVDDIGVHILNSKAKLRKIEEPKKEVAVSVEILEKYVGEYELTDAFSITTTREENSLFLQATNQPRLQLYAEKQDRFFVKEVKASVSFKMNDKGEVTGLVLHQGGANIPGKKVK